VTPRGIAMTGFIACIEETENVWENVVGKPEGKITGVKCKCAWEDNIKVYLTEMACECVVLFIGTWFNVAMNCSVCMSSKAGVV
jgi:hypothetical protein